MISPEQRKRRRIPHNPTVRELIKGKRQTSTPAVNVAAGGSFKGWHERGYLPHRDAPGFVQFVTFRLLVGGWKSCTAREANKRLNTSGAFWQADYWDTFMRDGDHTNKARRYIENNPVKAGLATLPHNWPWSSARYRSSDDNLQVRSAGVLARSTSGKTKDSEQPRPR